VTLARSSSDDDNAIRYIRPVLWMTSCFHIMGQIGRTDTGLESATYRIIHRHSPGVAANCAPGGEVGYRRLPCVLIGSSNTVLTCPLNLRCVENLINHLHGNL